MSVYISLQSYSYKQTRRQSILGARLYVWSPQKLKILLEMQSKFPVIFGITNNIGQRAKQYACPNIFIGGQMPRLLHWIDTCVSRLYMAQTLF